MRLIKFSFFNNICNFFLLQEKEKILSVIDPLTFDLVYDLAHSSSCVLCPILNNYDDMSQRSFTVEVSTSCEGTTVF